MRGCMTLTCGCLAGTRHGRRTASMDGPTAPAKGHSRTLSSVGGLMYQNQNVKRCSEDSTDGSLEPQHGAAESQASFPLVTTLLTHLADGGISWEAVEIPRPGSTFTRSLVP